MTTFQWLQGLALSMITPWLILPASGFLWWLLFAVRIGRRHHLTEADLLRKESKWIT